MSNLQTNPLGCLRALKSSYDPTDAICDLVDNSIDAAAKHVYIEINPSKAKNRAKPIESIWLIDDGDGFQDVKEAFVLGHSGKKARSKVPYIGQYGVGLLASAGRLGDGLVVITRTAGQAVTCVKFDATCAELKWQEEMCEDEVELYHKAWKEKREALGFSPEGSGTILVVEGIEMRKYSTVRKFVNALKGSGKTMVPKLGATFGYILANEDRLKIFLNGDNIEPHDPTYHGAPGVSEAYQDSFWFAKKPYGKLTITELPEDLRTYSDDIGISLYLNDRRMYVDNKFFGMIKGKSSYSHAPVRVSLQLNRKEWEALFDVSAAKNSFNIIVDEEQLRNTFEEKYYREYIKPILDAFAYARDVKAQRKADEDLENWPTLIAREAQSRFPVELRVLASSIKQIKKKAFRSKTAISTYDASTGELCLNSRNPLVINHEAFKAKKAERIRSIIYGLLTAFTAEANYEPSVRETLTLNSTLMDVLD